MTLTKAGRKKLKKEQVFVQCANPEHVMGVFGCTQSYLKACSIMQRLASGTVMLAVDQCVSKTFG